MNPELSSRLERHPLTAGLTATERADFAACCVIERVGQGELLFSQGDPQERLLLVLGGEVGLEVAGLPAGPTCVETVGPGEVLGISWLTPLRPHFDCRARTTVELLAIDQGCLRRRMDASPRLGYALASRLLELTYRRLDRVRQQRLDLYR